MRTSVVIVAFFFTAVCHAQDSRGSITGQVTDPQKAAVPGTTITITNSETNVTGRAQTNQNGYFEVDLLNPGSYSVTAEAPGFKKTVRSNVTLSVGGRLDIGIELEIGQVDQTVEVTAEAPLLDTTSAEGGRVINNKDVMQLPFTSMNPFALSGLSAGMQWTGSPSLTRVFDNAGTASFNTMGGVGTNEYLLDGAPVTGDNGARVGFAPSSEAVGEFRLETTTFDSSLGHTSGAVVNVFTKSGTNTYHGSLFDQMWQNRWNATPHFTRLAYYANLAAGKIAKGSPEQPSGRSNQFGFSLGGPFRIPKVYNGKNKLFFYFQFDGVYQANPVGSNNTVPTDAERQGDFSALLSVDPVKYTVYDPRSASTQNGHVTRVPFPGNKGVPVFNPEFKFWSQLFPEPNNIAGIVQPDGTANYFQAGQPSNENFKSIINRVDYNISDRQRIYGKWYWNHRQLESYDWAYDTPLRGVMDAATLRYNKGASGDYIFTISSSTILDFGMNFTRFYEGLNNPVVTAIKPSDLGLPTYLDTKSVPYTYVPSNSISGVQNIVSTAFDIYPNVSGIGTTAQAKLALTTIHGSHSLKYGWDERRYWYTSGGQGYTAGKFSFDNTYTRQADNTTTAGSVGLGWAAFMMGLPTGITLSTNDTGYYSTRYHAFYIQDDYRVNKRLRFGFGLRFEREGGTAERFNRGLAGGFDFNYVPAYANAVQAAYASNPLAQLPASQFKVAGGAYYLGKPYGNLTDGTNRLLPNVSAVFQITSKMVLRTGYGWFGDTFNSLSASNSRSAQNGYSQATTTTLTSDNGLTFCCGMGSASSLSAGLNPMLNPFPVRADGTRFSLPYGNSLGSDILDGQSYSFLPRNYAPALQQRWRVGLQRQITHDTMLDASYNGSYASTPGTFNLSYLPQQYWATGTTRNTAVDAAMTAAVPNPFYIGNLTSLQNSNATLYNYLKTISWFSATTQQTQQLLRAYPNQAGGLTGIPQGASQSDYRNTTKYGDLELQLEKRFSHGFQSSLSYTRANSSLTYRKNQFDQDLSWQTNNSVRPNRFVWTTIWELPFGKGRAFVNHNPIQHLVGGWQLSWVYQYQSGPATSWGNLFYYGDINQIESALAHDQAHSQDIHLWFNPAVSYNPTLNSTAVATGAIPSGFVGFEGRTALQPGTYQVRVFPNLLDSLRADGIRNWDAKIYRRFTIHERLNTSLSVDFLNATNQTGFNSPNLDPTNPNFGRVTSQNGGSRQIQFDMRVDF